MAHHLMKETPVDIYQYPQACREAQPDQQITMGDLHGNAMKLVFMLVKEGVALSLTAATSRFTFFSGRNRDKKTVKCHEKATTRPNE